MKTFDIVMAIGWIAMAIFHAVYQHPTSWWATIALCLCLAIKYLETATWKMK